VGVLAIDVSRGVGEVKPEHNSVKTAECKLKAPPSQNPRGWATPTARAVEKALPPAIPLGPHCFPRFFQLRTPRTVALLTEVCKLRVIGALARSIAGE